MKITIGTLSMMVLVCLLSGTPVRAEDPPAPPPGQGRGQFNPEQMRQRMLDRLKETLAPTDDEWKLLQPKIEAVQKIAFASRAGGFGFGRGRGRPADPNAAPAADAPPKTDLQKKREELQALVDNKDSDPKAVKDKMVEYHDLREKSKVELKKAQDDLREILTPRQEAQLVLAGLLD